MLCIINLFFLFLIIRLYKKVILKYLKKILNQGIDIIKIIACGLLFYVLLVLIIGACPLYK